MLFNEIIKLITLTDGTSDTGDPIKKLTESDNIYADKQSIKRNEFYQAAANGFRPELTFVIRTIDYNAAKLLKWGSKTYDIIRTYELDSEFIELICQGVTNNATT